MKRWVGILLLASSLGCQPKEQPEIPLPGSDKPHTVAQAAEPPPSQRPGPRRAPPTEHSPPAPWSITVTVPNAPNGEADQAGRTNANAPERDLAQELRTLVSNPSACFVKRAAGSGPSTLTLNINATVTPSGMVNRASVSGGSLSEEESACLEAIVVRGRFRSPVEDAPTTVSTTLELREQAPVKNAP